jgi:hypothetical protein
LVARSYGVDREEVKILVAVVVVHVQYRRRVVRPRSGADGSLGLVRDHAIAATAAAPPRQIAHPNVHDAVGGRSEV